MTFGSNLMIEAANVPVSRISEQQTIEIND